MNNTSAKTKASWAEPTAHGVVGPHGNIREVSFTSSPTTEHKQILNLTNFGSNHFKKEPSLSIVRSQDSLIDFFEGIVSPQAQKPFRDPPSPRPPSVPPNTPLKKSVRFSLTPSSKHPKTSRKESKSVRPNPLLPRRSLPNTSSKKLVGVGALVDDVRRVVSGGGRPTPSPPPRPPPNTPLKRLGDAQQASLFLRGTGRRIETLPKSSHFDFEAQEPVSMRKRKAAVDELEKPHFPRRNGTFNHTGHLATKANSHAKPTKA